MTPRAVCLSMQMFFCLRPSRLCKARPWIPVSVLENQKNLRHEACCIQ